MKTSHFLLTISLGIVIILVIGNIASIQACTPYENCVKTLPHSATQTASFNGNHATYGIQYNLSNATLVASLLDIPARELIFKFNATDVGQLMVELPRGIIDSTRYGNDKPYLVFVGDVHSGTKRVQVNEIQNTSSNRILIINFTKNDNEIGIIGTFFIENNSTAKIHNGYGAWSPLQQYGKGFDAQDTVCKNGFALIIKTEDNSPACVKPQTAQKLVERGWTTSILSLHSNLDVESKITDNDTYLSQTVDEWKSKTPEQLDVYYKKYKDAFYDELGSFLIKDEMKKELERQKIQNMHDDFKVFSGITLTSLPPHISYDAVVNATDRNSYLLLGGVFANKVESVAIKKLVFDKDVLDSLSTGKKPSFTNTFERSPKVVISEQSGTNPVVVPYNLALDLDKGNLVTFHNNLTVPIRIQPYGSGLVVDEGGLSWKSKIIGPSELLAIQFNKTGYYEWNARSPPQGSENWWGYHGSGQIAVFSLNHDDSASGDKLKMAQVFVSNSDIPWSSTGLDIHGNLEISLYESVYHMIPDAQKYYLSRTMQLIPFDVPVIISSPSFIEK